MEELGRRYRAAKEPHEHQGICYYCGCAVMPLDQPYNGSPEYREARKAYLESWGEAGSADREHQDYLTQELYPSELRERFYELDSPYREMLPTRAQIDHRVPVARGGSDERENLVLACQKCNVTKGARTVEEFRAMPHDPIAKPYGDILGRGA